MFIEVFSKTITIVHVSLYYSSIHCPSQYIYTPNLLLLCITRITVHAMHKYGSCVLSSRTYRCYVVDTIDLVSVVPIYSLTTWNCCIQIKRTQQLSSAIMLDDWRGLRTTERNIQINSTLFSSLRVLIFSLLDCSPVHQHRPYTAKTTACILNHTPVHEIIYTTQNFILLKLKKFIEIGTMWDARTKP